MKAVVFAELSEDGVGPGFAASSATRIQPLRKLWNYWAQKAFDFTVLGSPTVLRHTRSPQYPNCLLTMFFNRSLFSNLPYCSRKKRIA